MLEKTRIIGGIIDDRRIVTEPICDLSEIVTDELSREMLLELKKNLSNIIFQKDYTYSRVTEYLAHMYESIDENQIIINALDKIKKMDEYTFTHSINTAFYSMFIAIWMGLSDHEIINATQAGLLHDIGKIYIPAEILNKKGRLTIEEYEVIQKHPLYGYFLLNEFSEVNLEVKRAVLFHHERIDASGYPLNAASDYVGVLPKIIAVADVYDAMTTDRVYKKGAKPIEAIEFLSNEGRKTLDNQVLMFFLDNIPLYDFKSVSMTKQGGQFNCKSIPF
ncbi:HD domain-containing protein [Acetobacterium paludosum]|uniref:HD domain-containing protein n=1 Tax=Acetobacterium paludosum TaxID=52693 RepID=A0A923KR45_9FIRM|nr:HD-GYP domain-containing protein [Acetobacterium paludosum]MBC3889789.1 HD domain-containing protein [Acetobacterium paludosum]